MDKWTIISIVLLFFTGAGVAWYVKPPERIYHTDHQQRKIDSLTVALVNTRASEESLEDSLNNTTEAFQKYVQDHEGQIASLTTIRGRLNTKIDQLRDSLEQVTLLPINLPIAEDGEGIADTTIQIQRTFGDSLFQVTSENRIQDNQFTDELLLRQLRDIRIDLAILVSDDKRTVESVATSRDLDSLRVTAQTTIEPEKQLHWTIWVSIGILLKQGVDLIF